MEVAGKVLDHGPELVWRGDNAEKEGETSTSRKNGPGAVVVDGESVPCDVYEIETLAESQTRLTKIYYAQNRPPYVLKKESITTGGEDDTPLVQTVEQVVATGLQLPTPSGTLSTSLVQTMRKQVQGTVFITAIRSEEVPGGVVSHTSNELDEAGRVIRRSTLSLIRHGRSRGRLDQSSRFLGRRSRAGIVRAKD
jgi:hypothetical protein